MRLTEKQKAVLLALTNEWQTPTQIAKKLPGINEEWAAMYGSSYVNQPLKALMREGLVKKKPDTRGQYRLTPFGAHTKDKVARETQR